MWAITHSYIKKAKHKKSIKVSFLKEKKAQSKTSSKKKHTRKDDVFLFHA